MAAAKGDPYKSSPASAMGFEVVVPHASNNLSFMSRGIYVGGVGDVAAVASDGSVAIFSAVPAGTILPIQCIRINAVGTTATLMTAMF